MNSIINDANRAMGRTWAEINLDNIAHNAREIRALVSKNAEVMGIVKADAYGHGAVEVSKVLIKNGFTRLGVSMLDEALQLRHNGIDVPILILSDAEDSRNDELINNDITVAVFSKQFAESLSQTAVRLNKTAKIHIKLDTGMGRVGFIPETDIDLIKYIYSLPNIFIEGIFTHFAIADEENISYTNTQFDVFCNTVKNLEDIGINIPIKHVANSAAILRCPEMHLNMVRAGIIIYGLFPSKEIFTIVNKCVRIQLKPAMILKSRITLVKTLQKSSYISYGCTHSAKAGDKIATIPIGYADGFLRRLGNKAEVFINGHRAKIIGRVCMDQSMADVTDITDVQAGDIAVIFGEGISCDELADCSDTINYEIVCLIGKRVPRVHMINGEYVNVMKALK